MINLTDAIGEIVVPAVTAVFRDGEVTEVAVQFAPELDGGLITVTLVAVGERFHDFVVQGNVDGNTIEGLRERLRSDMADLVAESRFGWGQNRGV